MSLSTNTTGLLEILSSINDANDAISQQTTLIEQIETVLTTKGYPVFVNLYNEATRINRHYISAQGVSYEDVGSCHSVSIPCSPNTVYTFCGTTSNLSDGNKRFHVYDSNGNWISQLNTWLKPHATNTWAIQGTTPANGAYLKISMFEADTNVMVVKGSTAPTEYIPYRSSAALENNTTLLMEVLATVKGLLSR